MTSLTVTQATTAHLAAAGASEDRLHLLRGMDFDGDRSQMRSASGPGALGFHPLDLGQQEMQLLFGFALEGRPEPDDLDAAQVTMLGYRVTDPNRCRASAWEATLQEFLQRVGPPRSYRMGPSGSLVELHGDSGQA